MYKINSKTSKQIDDIIDEINNLKKSINSNKIFNLNPGVNSPEYITQDDLGWKKVINRCSRLLNICENTIDSTDLFKNALTKLSSNYQININDLDTLIYELDNIKLDITEFIENSQTNHNVLNNNLKQQDNHFSKIFISHYSGDKKIVGNIINLLNSLQHFDNDSLFCSSFPPYDIPLGEEVMPYIKKQFDNNVLVLFVLTKEFFKRPICMCEMGAAWVKAKSSILIIDPNLDYSEIKGVLSNTQAFKLNDKDGLNKLYKLLKANFSNIHDDFITWETIRDNFITNINTELDEKTNFVIDNNYSNSSYKIRGRITNIHQHPYYNNKFVYSVTLNKNHNINIYSNYDISNSLNIGDVIEAIPYKSNNNVDFDKYVKKL